jgi:hypothetical protein
LLLLRWRRNKGIALSRIAAIARFDAAWPPQDLGKP